MSLHTIRSRIARENIDCVDGNQISPVAAVETIICDFCRRLAKIGDPLTKGTVVQLANDLIAETEFATKVVECKEICQLNPESALGNAWYRGFMKCHEALLTTKKANFKDTKQNTWVRREHFINMYENAYEAMVTAGVAEKVDSPEESPSRSLFHYKLTRPEYLLFVDETGCNTNQLNDGKVGGEQFIMPKDDPESGAPIGATTDLHFTVLPFVSGTGDAVMCAIIFKSEQKVSEILLS